MNTSLSEIFFVITSGGRATTHWLSHLLNRSPDIFCMHGIFSVRELEDGEKNTLDDFSRTGYEVGDIHDLDGSTLSSETWKRMRKERWERFINLTIDSYFEELQSTHKVKVFGNVHGYTYDTFFHKLRENPPQRNIRFCNLTRHPVSRAQSFFRRYSHIEQWVPEPSELTNQRKSSAQNLRNEILARFDIDIYDEDKWLFPDTMLRMIIQYAEAVPEDLPHIKSEELTSDKEEFKKVFSKITDGRVELTNEMLSDDNFSKKLNRTMDKSISPLDQFEAWAPWQQYTFTKIIQPEWLKSYERIGYDISFIH